MRLSHCLWTVPPGPRAEDMSQRAIGAVGWSIVIGLKLRLSRKPTGLPIRKAPFALPAKLAVSRPADNAMDRAAYSFLNKQPRQTLHRAQANLKLTPARDPRQLRYR